MCPLIHSRNILCPTSFFEFFLFSLPLSFPFLPFLLNLLIVQLCIDLVITWRCGQVQWVCRTLRVFHEDDHTSAYCTCICSERDSRKSAHFVLSPSNKLAVELLSLSLILPPSRVSVSNSTFFAASSINCFCKPSMIADDPNNTTRARRTRHVPTCPRLRQGSATIQVSRRVRHDAL